MAKPAELFRNLAHGGPLHAGPVGKNANRQARIVHALESELGASLLVVRKLDPLERNVAPLKEIADSVSLRRATLSIKADSWKCFHRPGSTFCGLAFLGRYNVNAPWHLGHFFAVTLRAFRLRVFVLSHTFDALEGLAALFTAILVGGHPPLHDNSFCRASAILYPIMAHVRFGSMLSIKSAA